MNLFSNILRSRPLVHIVFFVVGVFLSSASPSPSQDRNANARIKAMFVYNFSKYVEWPQSYKEGSFVIGVLGQTPLKSELEKMAASKKAVTQPFSIKQFSSVDEIKRCHMLFISRDRSTMLKSALSKVKNYSTLVITEKDGLAKQGAGVNFVVQQSKQRFEINRANLEKAGLKVSESLVALAIKV